MSEPPVPRLHMNLSIGADSVDDLAEKLEALALEVSMRDEGEWNVSSSRGWSFYTVFNPDMTAERYRTELDAWWKERKARRRQKADGMADIQPSDRAE